MLNFKQVLKVCWCQWDSSALLWRAKYLTCSQFDVLVSCSVPHSGLVLEEEGTQKTHNDRQLLINTPPKYPRRWRCEEQAVNTWELCNTVYLELAPNTVELLPSPVYTLLPFAAVNTLESGGSLAFSLAL